MNNIVIVRADDWEVLYVNGRERLQGETISVQDIVQYAQNIEVTWATKEMKEYVSEHGHFPPELTIPEKDE